MGWSDIRFVHLGVTANASGVRYHGYPNGSGLDKRGWASSAPSRFGAVTQAVLTTTG
jgi:hypothetical protein